jgi:hypothetical protein
VREKYCWLVADKPSEQGVRLSLGGLRLLEKRVQPELKLPELGFVAPPPTIWSSTEVEST